MKPTPFLLLAAAAMPLGACTSMNTNHDLATVGTGAAIGAAGGAAIGAIAGDTLAGAAIGAVAGGIAGAIWADRDNDGRVDGYTYNGQYYSGAPDPARYAAAPRCRSVGGTALTGAGIGAATGAGVGAVASGIGVLEGALVGAAVGGLAGAIWADSNNDGCVDGYMREGRYYSGTPYDNREVVQPTNYRAGERG